ncbi:MAG: cobalamin-binding protein [Gammaproteobacteria bacterium]|nr:cobalamin-binding protein [Gammaproteobacteria bacterium]
MTRRDARRLCSTLLLLWPVLAMAAPRCVTDDSGREICLREPARRIIALSPGATELLFAAGAGERVVGTTSYSDYPPAAERINRIGSYERFDLEAIVAAQPDLVIAWQSGNPAAHVSAIERLGLTVYRGEQRALDDIPASIERYGVLAGTEPAAMAAARSFRDGLAAIRARYVDAPQVQVFYQVWDDPLLTAGGDHLISRAIAECGGELLFSALDRPAPRVDVEAVLAADPETILVSGRGENDPAWLDTWRAYPKLRAVRAGNLYFVPPSLLVRATPRVLEGIRTVCAHLDEVRARR